MTELTYVHGANACVHGFSPNLSINSQLIRSAFCPLFEAISLPSARFCRTAPHRHSWTCNATLERGPRLFVRRTGNNTKSQDRTARHNPQKCFVFGSSKDATCMPSIESLNHSLQNRRLRPKKSGSHRRQSAKPYSLPINKCQSFNSIHKLVKPAKATYTMICKTRV